MTHPVIGQRIIDIRYVDPETIGEVWDFPIEVMVLENGNLVYAQSDDEGNDQGTIVYIHPGEQDVYYLPESD